MSPTKAIAALAVTRVNELIYGSQLCWGTATIAGDRVRGCSSATVQYLRRGRCNIARYIGCNIEQYYYYCQIGAIFACKLYIMYNIKCTIHLIYWYCMHVIERLVQYLHDAILARCNTYVRCNIWSEDICRQIFPVNCCLCYCVRSVRDNCAIASVSLGYCTRVLH